MSRLNRDTLVSTVILLVMAFFYAATFTIPETTYNSMKPAVWPQVAIGFTAFWTVVYLAQSLGSADSPRLGSSGGVRAFFSKYRNALICFFLFGAFVAVLPYLGILIAGVLFVFAVLAFIGGKQPKMIALYAGISITTVVGFWAIFTFLLGVMLPEGEVLKLY